MEKEEIVAQILSKILELYNHSISEVDTAKANKLAYENSRTL